MEHHAICVALHWPTFIMLLQKKQSFPKICSLHILLICIMQFLLWSFLKYTVYETNPHTLDKLNIKILSKPLIVSFCTGFLLEYKNAKQLTYTMISQQSCSFVFSYKHFRILSVSKIYNILKTTFKTFSRWMRRECRPISVDFLIQLNFQKYFIILITILPIHNVSVFYAQMVPNVWLNQLSIID